jgi:hypothetical protein
MFVFSQITPAKRLAFAAEHLVYKKEENSTFVLPHIEKACWASNDDQMQKVHVHLSAKVSYSVENPETKSFALCCSSDLGKNKG